MTGRITIKQLLTLTGCAFLVASVSAWAQPDAGAEYGYGFYRTVEGRVLLTGLEADAEPLNVEPNYPLLTGDRIWVAERGRLEAVLPDMTIIRMAEETEVFFESLAGASDGEEGASTLLRLLEGELQLVAEDYVRAADTALVATDNADVYLGAPGTYRLYSDGRGWTEVVVRDGFAEIATERGSEVARSGERVIIDGERRPEVAVLAADSYDALEQWGAELSGEVRLADTGYVDDSLAYAAAPLARQGAWVSVSGRYAWRPTVRVGWRPYYDGWWATTPSGLSWVAYEPWGWVTAHYGAWDYVPGYGWLWFPGTVYSPAWVYWYWGPTHVAWIPSGYYTRFYGPRFGFGFRFGVYGWAGGYWDSWHHWTFCPSRYFGRRSYRPYWRSGHDLARDRRLRAVPRGIVTTDTRGIRRGHFGKPTEIYEILQSRARGAAATRELPDVSGFVARRTDLSEETRQVIRSEPGDRAHGTRSALGRRTADRIGDQVQRRTDTAPWTVGRPDRTTASPRTPVGRGGDRDQRRADSAQWRARQREGEAPYPGIPPIDREVVRRDNAEPDDWELVERLRRFETKREEMPRSPRAFTPQGRSSEPPSPRAFTPQGRSSEPRRALPPAETPTRRILEGLRSRTPQGRDVDRRPTGRDGRSVSPPTSQRPPTASGRGGESSARSRSIGSSRPSSGRSSGVSRPSGRSRPSSSARPSSGSSSRSRPRGRPRKD